MSTLNVRRRRKAQLGAWSNGMRMSPEEFDERTDFDELYAYELINAVLIVSPPPGESERDPNDELAYLFRSHQLNHELGSRIDKTLNEFLAWRSGASSLLSRRVLARFKCDCIHRRR